MSRRAFFVAAVTVLTVVGCAGILGIESVPPADDATSKDAPSTDDRDEVVEASTEPAVDAACLFEGPVGATGHSVLCDEVNQHVENARCDAGMTCCHTPDADFVSGCANDTCSGSSIPWACEGGEQCGLFSPLCCTTSVIDTSTCPVAFADVPTSSCTKDPGTGVCPAGQHRICRPTDAQGGCPRGLLCRRLFLASPYGNGEVGVCL